MNHYEIFWFTVSGFVFLVAAAAGDEVVKPYFSAEELQKVQALPITSGNVSFALPLDDHEGQPVKTRAYMNSLWEYAQVPYELHSSLNSAVREEIAQAIRNFHDNTCIRFIPKQPRHHDWVSIEYDVNTPCGWSHYGRIGGKQLALLGRECTASWIMVHELGHTMGLSHEHQREDRDAWIDWDTSKCQAHPTDGYWFGLHKFYDYLSSQHYQGLCRSGCIKPKEEGVTDCGSGGPLSVLDIELLNEMYGCTSGCFGYRYVNHGQDLYNPVVVSKDWDDEILYACRAYHDGDIMPGKYKPSNRICYVTNHGREHMKSGSAIEVLTDPNGAYFRWVKSSSLPENAVKGGRTAQRETLYVVRCHFKNLYGHDVTFPGKWQGGTAWAGFGHWEHNCHEDYEFLVCGGDPVTNDKNLLPDSVKHASNPIGKAGCTWWYFPGNPQYEGWCWRYCEGDSGQWCYTDKSCTDDYYSRCQENTHCGGIKCEHWAGPDCVSSCPHR